MIFTTIILGGTLFGLMPCITCCIGIGFKEAVIGMAYLGGVVASTQVIVFIIMAWYAISSGRVCRGYFLDEFAGSGIENYQPIS